MVSLRCKTGCRRVSESTFPLTDTPDGYNDWLGRGRDRPTRGTCRLTARPGRAIWEPSAYAGGGKSCASPSFSAFSGILRADDRERHPSMTDKRVYLYDCTLRDGAQTLGVDFTTLDKQVVARELDRIGID